MVGTTWAVWVQSGRTPEEIIDYTKRRLQGHPTLEALALPVLDRVRVALAEPAAGLPFQVPPPPPNPANAEGSATGAASPGAGAAAVAAPDESKLIRVGPKRAITRIAVAAQLAQDGSVIEIDPGDYVADVTAWDRAELTIRGLGNRVRLLASGAHAEGKAIWVVRRGRVTVENIEFVGARVPDGNGAGIRLESGQLTVRRCSFINNQSGILTSGEPDTRLTVEDSVFGYNGAGDGLTHAIYVGPIESFTLRGSYLHHGNVGHLVKSRARMNRIEYNRLSDEAGGRSSYELELPNGGVAELVGNIVQQGTGTQNSVIVSYGVEGYRWPRNELRMAHNTVVNDQSRGGTFLRVASGANLVVLRNNLFVGTGKVDPGPTGADSAGDQRAQWSDLVRPVREDYRINAAARASGPFAAQPLADPALLPRQEYRHPAGTIPLAEPPRWVGALQSAGP